MVRRVEGTSMEEEERRVKQDVDEPNEVNEAYEVVVNAVVYVGHSVDAEVDEEEVFDEEAANANVDEEDQGEDKIVHKVVEPCMAVVPPP
jgi:hypothetical protein